MTKFRLRQRLRLAALSGAVGAAADVVSTTPGGGGGIGFVQRPYFYQTDRTRLLASMTANDPEAFGSFSNNWGQTLAFISICQAAIASGGRGTWPPTGSYNDIKTKDLGVAGRFLQDFNGTGTAMMTAAKSEVMSYIAQNPSGVLSSEPVDMFQHCEEYGAFPAQVADCCYEVFSAGELSTLATWFNQMMAWVEDRNRTYWPGIYAPTGKEAVNNNYFNNQTLLWSVAALCTEGWNASASAHRAHFETIAQNYVDFYSGGSQGVGYVGAQLSEGRYYGQYIRNALWAMRQYDSVMGTTYLAQMEAAGAGPADHLEMALFQLIPQGARYHVLDGSEPNSANALVGTNGSAFLWSMAGMSDPSSTAVRVLKSITARSDWLADNTTNWSRDTKCFENWYWSMHNVSALPVSSLTQRRLAMPSPGAARTIYRSAAGWDGSSTSRAATVFSCMFDPNGSTQNSAGFSHGNPDAPGFQLTQGPDRVVTDVEYSETGGVAGTGNEAGHDSAAYWANIITLASTGTPASGWPIQLFNEDHTGDSIPHFYKSINAQPAWNMCATYRREYVVLDDLQVWVIFDSVATAGSNAKTFRMHVDAAGGVSIAAGVATWTTGATSARLRDLYSTDGNAMATGNPYSATDPAGPTIKLISQSLPSNSVRSLKVLDLNSRCSAASLSSGSGYLQADLTINGVARSVRFFDDGSHCTVS